MELNKKIHYHENPLGFLTINKNENMHIFVFSLEKSFFQINVIKRQGFS